MKAKVVFGLFLFCVLSVCGCVKAPSCPEAEAELKRSLETAWEGRGVTVEAVHLQRNGKNAYRGAVAVSGKGWKEDVAVTVKYQDETLIWEVSPWQTK